MNRAPRSSPPAGRWPTVPVVSVPMWHAFGVIGSMGVGIVGPLASISTHELNRRSLAFDLSALVVVFMLWVLTRRFRSRWFLMIWPFSVLGGLLGAATVAPHAATLCTSAIVLGYLYTGLTQPPGTSLALLLPAAAVYASVYSALPLRELAVKLAVVSIVWIAVGELPAWLNAKLRSARADLARLAATDPLTGLTNRRYWDDELSALLERGQALAVLLVDLDHFKRFNDEHGHLAGDQMLVAFARVIEQSTAPADIAARWGGEEFAVAVHDLARARKVAEQIRRHVPLGQTCSIGVVEHQRGESVTDLMGRADDALYRAKTAGRNCVVAA